MKNLPEEELFNHVRDRLREFSEFPDETVWENIAPKIATHRERGHGWTRVGITLLLLVLGFSWRSDLQEEADHLFGEISKPSSSTLHTLKDADEIKKDRDEVENFYNEIRVAADPDSKAKARKAFASGSELRHVYPLKATTIRILVSNSLIVNKPFKIAASGESRAALPHPPRKPEKKLTYYSTVTPVLSYFKISPRVGDETVVTGIESRPVFSSERFGWFAEAGIQLRTEKKWQAFAGLSFYHQRQTFSYGYQDGEMKNVPGSGDSEVELEPVTKIGELRYNMTNLGIHSGLLYHLKGKKLKHKLGLGLSFHQGIGSREGNYHNGASAYGQYHLFYRNEYTLNHQFSVFVQPHFSHSILVREKLEGPFLLTPFVAGLGLGVVIGR